MVDNIKCNFKKYTEQDQARRGRPWLDDLLLTPVWFCVECKGWHCAPTPPCSRCGIVIENYNTKNLLRESRYIHLCNFCAGLLKTILIAVKGYDVWGCGDLWAYGDYVLNKADSLQSELQIIETELTVNHSIYDIEALLNLYDKRRILQRGIESLKKWAREDCIESRWSGAYIY